MCGQFYFCVDGKFNMITCPSGLVYNEKTGICTWPDEAKKKGCSSQGKSCFIRGFFHGANNNKEPSPISHGQRMRRSSKTFIMIIGIKTVIFRKTIINFSQKGFFYSIQFLFYYSQYTKQLGCYKKPTHPITYNMVIIGISQHTYNRLEKKDTMEQ